MPPLIGALKHDDWSVRKSATLALGELGPAARDAVPTLFDLLRSDLDRESARAALREIDTAGPEALPALIRAIEMEDPRMRYYAVFFLQKLGPDAKEALPALRPLLHGENSRLRSIVQRTIEAIEGGKSAETGR